ncbi:MAG TPA: cyclic nucleotide-binding domain-containing protein [Polyangiaceae bacterium]|jgi:CRP-like cAMP-binding protein
MLEGRLARVGREVVLTALGLPLENLDPWVIDRLTSILDEQHVHAGERMFTANEPAEFMYFMRDGEVRFTREGRHSWTFQGRWFLGGFEVLSERASSRTATALTDFDAMRLRGSAWVELLEDSFQLARSAVTNLARGVARLEERVPDGAPPSPRGELVLAAVPVGPLSVMERLALLLDIRMLRGAGVQALADLAVVSHQVSFRAGQGILGPGVEQGYVVRIVEGEVLAKRADPAVVRRYGPGDLVCGACVVGGVTDAWTADAVTPTRGIAIPLEALFDLMEEHFDLVHSVLAALGSRRQLLLEHLTASSDLVLK